ncbi:Lrp/AsnC family transcriptional regulator [Ktedonospora formicarum]|uniref:AsnC family transcriptional regulator n=1 Tax=Ktedonospora formicarum TaxID=2778364 RepID=A0A8J3IDX5_9CHLR|nr:Lrp/AsnC family transcriptional regulator [Ktedonospora formicarum]GHO50224.1 AsnC family transcriptional regulator [Ktedonospora formicarum]
MTLEIEKLLDETGWQLLQELQQNARLSYSELGQRVGLSAPAVADRLRRMEEASIINGYRAEINLAAVGLPIMAIIRLRDMVGQSCLRVMNWASEIPEVIECYRVTGNDMIVLKVVTTSIEHLDNVIAQLNMYGSPSTSVVLSRPTQPRVITHDLIQSNTETH